MLRKLHKTLSTKASSSPLFPSSKRLTRYTSVTYTLKYINLAITNVLCLFLGDARIFDANFSTSSSMDVSLFDVNFPARLEINCGWSGSAYIDVWAFTDVEYVQHFKVRCHSS